MGVCSLSGLLRERAQTHPEASSDLGAGSDLTLEEASTDNF